MIGSYSFFVHSPVNILFSYKMSSFGGQMYNNFSHLYGEKLSAKCRHKTLAKALRVGRCKCETNFKTLLHKGLQFGILFYHRIMKQEAQRGSSMALNTAHVHQYSPICVASRAVLRHLGRIEDRGRPLKCFLVLLSD